MYFNRFDICEAYYVFAMRHQRDSILRRLAKMKYRPGVMVEVRMRNGDYCSNDNVTQIYKALYKRTMLQEVKF